MSPHLVMVQELPVEISVSGKHRVVVPKSEMISGHNVVLDKKFTLHRWTPSFVIM